jgi:hypothetical protein
MTNWEGDNTEQEGDGCGDQKTCGSIPFHSAKVLFPMVIPARVSVVTKFRKEPS